MAYRSVRLSAALALLLGGLFPARPVAGSPVSFIPVQATRVVGPVYPPGSVATGTVLLTVTIAPSGTIRRLRVIHGVTSLTGAAEQAVRKWRFRAARFDGRPVESSITVALSFSSTFGSTARWVAPSMPESRSGFMPIRVISFAPPVFPITSVAIQGVPPFLTVVLKVSVGSRGRITSIRVMRGVPSLTRQAEQAVRKWRFRPAMLDGQPVASSMIATFTFRLLLGPMNSPTK